MDERIEKAFAVANYMATLSNQRRIILEEFNQKLVYYANGGTFKISPELINFTKSVIDFFVFWMKKYMFQLNQSYELILFFQIQNCFG